VWPKGRCKRDIGRVTAASDGIIKFVSRMSGGGQPRGADPNNCNAMPDPHKLYW